MCTLGSLLRVLGVVFFPFDLVGISAIVFVVVVFFLFVAFNCDIRSDIVSVDIAGTETVRQEDKNQN